MFVIKIRNDGEIVAKYQLDSNLWLTYTDTSVHIQDIFFTAPLFDSIVFQKSDFEAFKRDWENGRSETSGEETAWKWWKKRRIDTVIEKAEWFDFHNDIQWELE